jgi:hypothetical protein
MYNEQLGPNTMGFETIRKTRNALAFLYIMIQFPKEIVQQLLTVHC